MQLKDASLVISLDDIPEWTEQDEAKSKEVRPESGFSKSCEQFETWWKTLSKEEQENYMRHSENERKFAKAIRDLVDKAIDTLNLPPLFFEVYGATDNEAFFTVCVEMIKYQKEKQHETTTSI